MSWAENLWRWWSHSGQCLRLRPVESKWEKSWTGPTLEGRMVGPTRKAICPRPCHKKGAFPGPEIHGKSNCDGPGIETIKFTRVVGNLPKSSSYRWSRVGFSKLCPWISSGVHQFIAPYLVSHWRWITGDEKSTRSTTGIAPCGWVHPMESIWNERNQPGLIWTIANVHRDTKSVWHSWPGEPWRFLKPATSHDGEAAPRKGLVVNPTETWSPGNASRN